GCGAGPRGEPDRRGAAAFARDRAATAALGAVDHVRAGRRAVRRGRRGDRCGRDRPLGRRASGRRRQHGDLPRGRHRRTARGGAGPIAGGPATARAIAWAGAVVFAALALLIALAAVRIGLDRPEREAAVLALLGASPGFSAIPSALAGALYGACAALVAALTL